MRWEGVFEDLEARWDDLRWQQTRSEAAELTRGEWAALSFADRLRGAVGETVRLHAVWGQAWTLRLRVVGDGWCGGSDVGGSSLLLPFDSLAGCEAGLAAAAKAPGRASGRVSLAQALRGLARARAVVTIVGRHGATVAEGTVDRVGADHVDVARHARDEARRGAQVRGTLVVPFTALGAVSASRG